MMPGDTCKRGKGGVLFDAKDGKRGHLSKLPDAARHCQLLAWCTHYTSPRTAMWFAGVYTPQQPCLSWRADESSGLPAPCPASWACACATAAVSASLPSGSTTPTPLDT